MWWLVVVLASVAAGAEPLKSFPINSKASPYGSVNAGTFGSVSTSSVRPLDSGNPLAARGNNFIRPPNYSSYAGTPAGSFSDPQILCAVLTETQVERCTLTFVKFPRIPCVPSSKFGIHGFSLLIPFHRWQAGPHRCAA
eukprot:m.95677 g.95677  ORF g.95677 m.95677 type:complete len:139 (-) comp51297_c0_seq2:1487-1903(-)